MDICYDSAQHLLDRIRAAMGQRDAQYQLSSIVELVDSYVEGPSNNRKRGRRADKPKIVVTLSKSDNGAALLTRMKVIDGLPGKTLRQIVEELMMSENKVECDGYQTI